MFFHAFVRAVKYDWLKEYFHVIKNDGKGTPTKLKQCPDYFLVELNKMDLLGASIYKLFLRKIKRFEKKYFTRSSFFNW